MPPWRRNLRIQDLEFGNLEYDNLRAFSAIFMLWTLFVSAVICKGANK